MSGGQVHSIGMICPALPAAGTNATGTPLHVRKTKAALERLGAKVLLFELALERARSPLALGRVLTRLFAELRAARPDVLHVHGNVPACFALPPAVLLRIPMIVELHGVYVPSRPGQAGARPLLSRAAARAEISVLRRARVIVVQALAMRERLRRRGIPPGRIAVIYPGLATAEFTGYAGPAAELPGERPGDVAVVYVGSTLSFQGLDLLAAAQSHLPARFKVVLVTSKDSTRPEEVVGRFGFDPARTVVVHPESPAAIPSWCRRADVLVHARPDVPDNVNVQSKLGLYLASGRPIVATDVGDYPALLSGSRGCVLTRPEPRALAEGLVEAARPEVAAAAAATNPGIAQRHFDVDRNARRLLRLYELARDRSSGALREDASAMSDASP